VENPFVNVLRYLDTLPNCKKNSKPCRENFEQILNNFHPNSNKQIRDKVILLLSYHYNLKPSEIVGLNLQDVNLNAGLITVASRKKGVLADAYLAKTVEKYSKTASHLSEWIATNIPEGFTVFAFPAAFRKQLRTTNGLERLHREVRRRTRVVSIFPNPVSCLRLVSAILAETSEEWLTGRTYINFEGDALSMSKRAT
jgi:transposase-like protein